MLDSFRVKNLRSLKDTGVVNLRPITILLGENSCGKSTFLRSFPLLKQSAETSTRSSVLWFGKYVDFGDFDQALIRDKGAKEITFSFGLNVSDVAFKTLIRMHRSKMVGDIKAVVDLRLASLGKDGLTRTAGLDIRLEDNFLEVGVGDSGKISSIIINGRDYSEFSDSFTYRSGSRVLPFFEPKDDGLKNSTLRRLWVSLSSAKLRDGLLGVLKNFAHGKTSEETLGNMLHSAVLGKNEDMFLGFKRLSQTATWRNKTSSIDIDSEEYQRYRDLLILSRLTLMVINFDEILDASLRRVSYIEPIRASAQRYYRSQDIGVSELDSKGENLAMFIRNLSEKEKTSLDKWTSEELGLKIAVKYNEGHVNLGVMFEGAGDVYNLADMGFGFSQVMPVLVQLWTILNKQPKGYDAYINAPHICVIEQPELHLHPRFQAKLAEIFVRAAVAAKKAEIKLCLVLETHSEVIINKVGLMTASKVIDKEDSSIVLFSKELESSHTKVEFSSYDDRGMLQNWPFGFFDFEV